MRTCLLAAASVLLSVPAAAQGARATPAASDSLTREILTMDDSLSATFNRHDADALMRLFAPDVEFYHDIDGLQRYADVDAGFHSLLQQIPDIRRERVGALEVYPVPRYGAMEVGDHRFCHAENGKPVCGTFHFLQLWRRDPEGWRLTRVMSYGHE
jgi:hypothetical protein